jgi:hypothetical protein
LKDVFEHEVHADVSESLVQHGVRAAAHAVAPPLAWLEITADYRCNNRCVGCFAVADAGPAMTAPEIVAALRRGRNEGARGLWLGGGEPTLRRDLFATVRAARAMARRASSAPWLRPRNARAASSKDCTPRDKRLTPAAATWIRTCPGAGSGVGTSVRVSASGPPNEGMLIARIP